MELPSLEKVREIMSRVESGFSLDNDEASALVALIWSIMTPDHTWWRQPPVPPGTFMLLANDSTITPPMRFQTEHEAASFAQLNQTELYMPIPYPSCLKFEEKKKDDLPA
jgi:hypothetical protein